MHIISVYLPEKLSLSSSIHSSIGHEVSSRTQCINWSFVWPCTVLSVSLLPLRALSLSLSIPQSFCSTASYLLNQVLIFNVFVCFFFHSSRCCFDYFTFPHNLNKWTQINIWDTIIALVNFVVPFLFLRAVWIQESAMISRKATEFESNRYGH